MQAVIEKTTNPFTNDTRVAQPNDYTVELNLKQSALDYLYSMGLY